MLDFYLEVISQKIRQGTKVYLCPAAMETVIIAKMLKKIYNVYPSGFCDNDIRKQGKHLNSISTLKILSFDEATLNDDSEFLVVSPHHSAAIIGNLVFERGISESRIINYHSIEKKKTCALFAQNWIIEDKYFVCCCIEEYKPRFDHKKFDVEAGIEFLDYTRKGLIDGTIPIPEGCEKCFNNKPCYIYVSRKLNSFDFSFKGWCNYKCQYCSSNRPDLKGYNNKFSLEQYLIELENNDLINDIFSVLFAVGESCLNEKRFSLYEYCGKRKYFMDVFSNCSVFDQSLFDLANKSPVIIRKSFDAGTPETYAKIKGVNFYYKMLDNVRHYLEAHFLALNPKYLFVPGVNDNERDINGFVEMCEHMKVDFVTPVFSFLDCQFDSSDHAQKMFGYLVNELAKRNIFTCSVDTLYSEKYHNLYIKSFGNK